MIEPLWFDGLIHCAWCKNTARISTSLHRRVVPCIVCGCPLSLTVLRDDLGRRVEVNTPAMRQAELIKMKHLDSVDILLERGLGRMSFADEKKEAKTILAKS